MSAKFSEMTGWWIAILTLVGIASLGLMISSIESGLEKARYASVSERELARARGEVGNHEPTDFEDAASGKLKVQEEILESDSQEERIRKRYGLVKRAGVWLRAIPLASLAGGALSAGTSSSDPAEKIAPFVLPLYITTGRLPALKLSIAFESQIEAVGGSPPYRWTLDSGRSASGFSLNPQSGVISGRTDAEMNQAIRVRVTDSLGAADVAEFRLQTSDTGATPLLQEAQAAKGSNDGVPTSTTVSPNPTAPGTQGESPLNPVTSENGTETQPETVTALSLPATSLDEGKVGEEFQAQITAMGGKPPYAYVAVGPLPSGLAVSPLGIVTGVPTESGDFVLTISVSDQAGQQVAQTFALSIEEAALPPVTQFRGVIGMTRVALSWSSPSGFVRLVRNAVQPPTHDSDGVVVYEGAETQFTDAAFPISGCYYGAFAMNAEGSVSAEPAHLVASHRSGADPFADEVVTRQFLHPKAFNQAALPGIVLGPPRGGGYDLGSSDVVSLGAASTTVAGAAPYGGSITLAFANNRVHDGPGADFTVFENVFYVGGDSNSRMMEPATVSVSQDGVTWFTFPVDFSPRYDPVTGALNLRHPFVYNRGFAGVNPVIANGVNVDATDPAVSGGDSFDLADLQVPGLMWIRYIRIQSTGDQWLVDRDGDLIHHPNGKDTFEANRNFNKSGFDLDAVTAIWFDATE